MKAWLQARGVVGGALLSVALSAGHAEALPRYGPFELSGNISAQELIRFNPDVDRFALVQQRNTVKLRVDYQMLERGRLLNQLEVPFVESTKLLLLYRGSYDSVYDSTPGFQQKDIYGNPSSLQLDQLSAGLRDSIKFDNKLREAYTDVEFKQIPLSLRLGRQQIVWGETDNFRLLDRVNALDLTWHLQQESWDELRMPYWMIKGLWQFERIGPLSNSFLEFFWNPGDWNPSRKAFLPRPWSVPLNNPLPTAVNAFNAFGKGLNLNLNGSLFDNTTLFQQGDYTRNPVDNSQVGVRFSAVTPQGLQFTLDYFYARWNGGDDGTDSAAYSAVTDPTRLTTALKSGQLPIVAIMPYVHTAGFSLNYAEEEYTQTVYRMESVYEFGVPFSDTTKVFPTRGPAGTQGYLTVTNQVLGNDVFGVSKRDMWKGMVAFDRPTWIRPLNRRSTFLVLGQFFWHYLINNPNEIFCRDDPQNPICVGHPSRVLAKGFWGSFSSSGANSGGRVFVDKVRDWEVLTTLAATTFYSGGKIVPLLVYILDPVNSYNMEVLGSVDYFITNNFILNLSERVFVNTTSAPVFETWGVGGTNRGRSETGIRLTYQF